MMPVTIEHSKKVSWFRGQLRVDNTGELIIVIGTDDGMKTTVIYNGSACQFQNETLRKILAKTNVVVTLPDLHRPIPDVPGWFKRLY